MQQKLFLLTLASLTLIIMSWTNQEDWRSKVDAEILATIESGATVDFLIYMNEQSDISGAKLLQTKNEKGQYVYMRLRELARASQAEIIAELDAQQAEYRAYWVINALWAKGDLALVQTLAQRTDVQSIIANPSVKMEAPVEMDYEAGNTKNNVTEWGLQMINADDVWALGYHGEGVVIGGQDTGYDWTHPALQAKYRGWNDDAIEDHNHNWHDAIHEENPNTNEGNPCGFDVDFPCDDYSHGTHTMGTMVGDDEAGNQIGVAPNARWIACRNMEEGWGTPATYIECFEWFIAPTDLNGENADPTKAPHVFANSWGCPEIEGCNPSNFAVMEQVVNNVKNAGIVIVTSAGNAGNQCSTVSNPAAIYENSFSVGATRQNDTIAGFSSRGPVAVDGSGRLKPNISAPGTGVRSSVLNGGYAAYSGTSMAGPHVAGVVALLISAKPELAGQVDEIEDILEQSAVAKFTNENCGDVPGTNVPNNTYGYGRIDALAAVNLALGITNTDDLTTETSIHVYPNPFMDNLNIEFPGTAEQATIRLYNSNGQLITQQTLQSVERQTINTANLPSGVYFYQVEWDGEIENGKIVK